MSFPPSLPASRALTLPRLAALGLLLASGVSSANPVAIQDASFDVRSLSAGGWSTTITPWQETGGTGNGNGFVERISGFAFDGLNHLGMETGHNVWQDLGVTYQANMRYTLTVAVGNRSGRTNSANQSRYLLADSTGSIFATGSFNASTIPVGTFRDATPLVFETGASSSAIGRTIRILLQAQGTGRSHFDAVRLTAVSTVFPQTITFGPLDPITVGDPARTLTATASSGLPVTYTSSNPAVASVSGNQLTAHAAGTVSITASQAGNTTYLPAEAVSQTLTVFRADRSPQTIDFPQPATQTLGNDNTDINGSVESDAGDAIITGTNLVYSGYSLSATAGTGTANIIIDP